MGFFETVAMEGPGWLPDLATAAVGTVQLALVSMGLALVLGLVAALVKRGRGPVRLVAVSYVELMRNIPLLAWLFLFYFGLPELGIKLTSFSAAVLSLGVNFGGYQAEVFRAGIDAIHRDQLDAARAVGMSPRKAMQYIILPQAFRVVLPPTGSQFIDMLKLTSLASLIATPELMHKAIDIAALTFRPMEVYFVTGLVYLALSLPLSRLVRQMEVRLRRGRSLTHALG